MAVPQPSLEFADLLARARAGEEDALAELLLLSQDGLKRSVDQRLGDRLRAATRRSDIVQNVFVAVLHSLPGFRGRTREEFLAWVTQIAEHDIRRQHRWLGAKKRKPPTGTSQRNALARALLVTPATPSAELARGEQQAQVRAALLRLGPEHAQIIELAVFDELPHREIALRLGRSEGACRMLLQRARTALALELERLAGTD